jgi:hypothetical protein
MSTGNSPGGNFDLSALQSIVDRIVAANLTTAIYTRLHTIQSQDDYDETAFDEVARNVVREVMHTYSSLLNVFRGTHENPAEPDDGS